MHGPKLTTRYGGRWPQGLVGLSYSQIVKNARLYLAAPDGQVAKIGWGISASSSGPPLHDIAADGVGLVARENRHCKDAALS